MRVVTSRSRAFFLLGVMSLLLTACTTPPSSLALKPSLVAAHEAPSQAVQNQESLKPSQGSKPQAEFRGGRFSLVVDTEPQQSFLSSFDLSGGWHDGVLIIYNPLGLQMARVEWTPQNARLLQGGQTREAPDLEKLIFQLTGTQLPASALIDWLSGKPTPAEGWNVDLSEWHLRRLVLERVQPKPRTVLRIAFES